jgi:hypothetical protein
LSRSTKYTGRNLIWILYLPRFGIQKLHACPQIASIFPSVT